MRSEERTRLEAAIALANSAHAGAVYDEMPYILHPLRVMGLARPVDKIPAVLHDVVEDTTVSNREIYEFFGEKVARVVFALTRWENETYFDYIRRVSKQPSAARIKILDLEDNLSHEPPASLAARYEKALVILKGDLD